MRKPLTRPASNNVIWTAFRIGAIATRPQTTPVKISTKPRKTCATTPRQTQSNEVFEHWIVSDWLAEKLAAKGEKVDTDFAGLTVWARTTTGQGIASDSVIQDIVADLNKPESDA